MRTVITKTLGLVLMTAILTLSLTGCTDSDGVSETDAIETSSVGVITTPDEITSDIPKKQASKRYISIWGPFSITITCCITATKEIYANWARARMSQQMFWGNQYDASLHFR